MSLGTAFGQFWEQFSAVLPAVALRLILAWIGTFVVLIYGFGWLKKHLRPALLRLDEQVRFWALGLRYRVRGQNDSERHFWTWFFRFWTNFASAPSLSLLSLALGVLFVAWRGADGKLFFLPGLAYAGSMMLSFVSKRVFKRVRPLRDKGAFGHKLKDGSFPSGHSLTALCFWIMFAVCAFVAGLSWAPFLAVVGIAIVLLTGLSRVYMGVHWPSDVLGGYTIGVIWCLVCYFALGPAL